MKYLITAAILLLTSVASASMFMLKDMNGACAHFQRGPDASMYFCSQESPMHGETSFHFVKFDARNNQSKSSESFIVIENEKTKKEISLEFDEIVPKPESNGSMTTYIWIVPKVFLNLFREEVQARFRFYANGTWYVFSFTEDEKNQIKFISSFEAISKDKK